VIAVLATLLTVTASVLAGYVYSRYRSSAIGASALFMLAIRLLPPIVIILPLFPATSVLGLNDTYAILVMLYATFFVSLGSMVLKTYIDGIPEELDDAACIDGASEVQILLRLIVPLAAPGMVAAAVFVFVYAWNEYLFAFVFHHVLWIVDAYCYATNRVDINRGFDGFIPGVFKSGESHLLFRGSLTGWY